jgi:hypothetical protein
MKTKTPIMSQAEIDRHKARLHTEPTSEAIIALAEKIIPLLADKHPTLVGGALAELTAIWLAGHIGANPKETRAERAQLLAAQMLAIADLAASFDAAMDS